MALRDPAGILRRVAGRVPLRPHRMIGAVVSIRREYVVHAVDLPLVPPTRSATSPNASATVASRPPPTRLTRLATAFGPAAAAAAGAHVLVLVHCRPGRVVWLPDDLEWYELGRRFARTYGLRAADQVLVTEHGWRTRPSRLAGTTPTVALP